MVRCQVTGKEVPEGQWERETIIRWDEGTCELMLYTASAVQKRRWERVGVEFREMSPRSWQAVVDKRAWRVGVGKRVKRSISPMERERRRELGRAALAKAHEARRMRKIATEGGDAAAGK